MLVYVNVYVGDDDDNIVVDDDNNDDDDDCRCSSIVLLMISHYTVQHQTFIHLMHGDQCINRE